MGKVFVPYGESASDTAVLLLAEAENQGLPADVVTTTDGGFVVDSDLADSAGADYDKKNAPASSDEHARAQEAREQGEPVEQAPSPAETGHREGDDEPKRAAKKTAKKTARKSTAKKTAAKKTAKKTAAKKTAAKS